MDDLDRYRNRRIPLMCLRPRNRNVDPLLFPAEPWHHVLDAAVDEGWKPEHLLSEYLLDEFIDSAPQCVTSGRDFGDALQWAANGVPEDEDYECFPDYGFHLQWFAGRNKCILSGLIEFARSSGGFGIGWPSDDESENATLAISPDVPDDEGSPVSVTE